jgi:hypothetical protein
VRTIISACLMMFLFVSVCFADENTAQRVYPAWKDMRQSDCPTYRLKGTPGERILAIGGEIVDGGKKRTGSCWDFVDAVYRCAGYWEKCRTNIFGDENNVQGPYLEKWDIIRPGDWIMYINLEFDSSEGTTHSTIFVRWKDKDWKEKEQKIAETLDYVGRDRPSAGLRIDRNLTKVYCIKRAMPGKEEAVK